MECPKAMQIFCISGGNPISAVIPEGFYYYTGIYVGTNNFEVEQSPEETMLYVEHMEASKTWKLSLSLYNTLKSCGFLTEYEIATFVPA